MSDGKAETAKRLRERRAALARAYTQHIQAAADCRREQRQIDARLKELEESDDE